MQEAAAALPGVLDHAPGDDRGDQHRAARSQDALLRARDAPAAARVMPPARVPRLRGHGLRHLGRALELRREQAPQPAGLARN